MNNKFPHGIIEIEVSAEKIYYTILGNKIIMEKLLRDINSNDKNKKKHIYLISKIMVPVANILESEIRTRKKTIELASGLEHVQCSILCDCNSKEEKDGYILLCIKEINNKFVLTLPEIELKEDFEPEKIILDDIHKFVPDVPKIVKNTLKLIDITGKDSDTLIYLSRINKTENRKKIDK